MSYSFNPFTGCLDDVGNGIAKDGTTTTTASIPFAEGLSVAADKIIQLGSNPNNYLGFVSPDAVLLNADQATTDCYIQGRTFQFATLDAQFSTDLSGKLFFLGIGSQFDPGTGQQDIWGNTHFGINGFGVGSVTFDAGLTSTTFNIRPTFAAGQLINDDQTIRFGGSTRYMQRVSATNTFQHYLDNAADIFERRVRGASGSTFTQSLSFTSTANVADSNGVTAHQLGQTTALSYNATLANERRYLRIMDGSQEVLRLVPSTIQSPSASYKSAILSVRGICNRVDTAAGAQQTFLNATEAFIGANALTTSFTCVYGLTAVSPANASTVSTAGLDFSLLAYTPVGTGGYGTCHALNSKLQTPFSGTFDPLYRSASTARFALGLAGADFTEISIIDAQTENLGGYVASAGTFNGVRISTDMSGTYAIASTEIIGMNLATLAAGTYGTTRGYGIKLAAPSGTFTTTWAINADDDVQVNTNKKMIYEGTTTTKGDTYHVYDGTNLQAYVNGTKVWQSTATDWQHTSTKLGFFGATPVTRQTYSASNVTTDRTYDANATTIDELADVVGTLIADLRSFGLVI